MNVLGIDPGPEQTAFVWFDGTRPGLNGIVGNEEMLALLAQAQTNGANIWCEDIASYGMAVGASTFETCVWIGRFIEVARTEVRLCYRKDVKMYLCGSMRAKDANIRQRLIDIFGPQGTKKQPGKTFGMKSHSWAALAVAVYAAETNTKYK